MILRTYDASGPEKILVREQHFNAQDQPVFERLFDGDSYVDREHFYDEQGRLTSMVESTEEGESYRRQYQYRDDGELGAEQLLLGGAVYRETVHQFDGHTHTDVTYEGDAERERREESIDGNLTTVRYYDEGELQEVQVYTWDPESRSRSLQVRDAAGELLARGERTLDDQDRLLTSRQWVGENLVESADYTYGSHGQVSREVVGEYSEGIIEYTLDYSYDQAGNLIEREWREQSSGQLVGFERNRYDDQGRLVETVGQMNGVALGIESSGREERWVYGYEG